MGVVVEEGEESQLWLELIAEAGAAAQVVVDDAHARSLGINRDLHRVTQNREGEPREKEGTEEKRARLQLRRALDYPITRFSDYPITP